MFDFGIKRAPVAGGGSTPIPEGILIDLERRNAARFPAVSLDPFDPSLNSIYYSKVRLLNSTAQQAGTFNSLYLMLSNRNSNDEALYVSTDDINYFPVNLISPNLLNPVRVAHNSEVILICQFDNNTRFAWSRDGINYTISSNTIRVITGDNTTRSISRILCVNNIFFLFTNGRDFYTATFDPNANGGVGEFTFIRRSISINFGPVDVSFNNDQINPVYFFTTVNLAGVTTQNQMLRTSDFVNYNSVSILNGNGIFPRRICWNNDENKYVAIDVQGRIVEINNEGTVANYITNIPVGINAPASIFYNDFFKGYICVSERNTELNGNSVVFTMDKNYRNIKSFLLEDNTSFTGVRSAYYDKINNELFLAYEPNSASLFQVPNCRGSFVKGTLSFGPIN